MKLNKHGFVVVVTAEGKPEGIVTEWDYLSKLVAEVKDPAKVTLGDIMSSDLITVKASDGIDYVAKLMAEKGIRRVLVLGKEGKNDHAQVLAILLVDALNILGDHHLNAGTHLRVRRLLAARSLAAPLPAHRAHKAAALHIATSNGRHAPALQPKIRNLAQRLVEIKAVMRRGDLVGRDVVAQLGIIRRILRVPRQIFARQLPFDQFGVFGEEKNASAQPHLVRPLFDLAFKKRVDHVEPVGVKNLEQPEAEAQTHTSIVTRPGNRCTLCASACPERSRRASPVFKDFPMKARNSTSRTPSDLAAPPTRAPQRCRRTPATPLRVSGRSKLRSRGC